MSCASLRIVLSTAEDAVDGGNLQLTSTSGAVFELGPASPSWSMAEEQDEPSGDASLRRVHKTTTAIPRIAANSSVTVELAVVAAQPSAADVTERLENTFVLHAEAQYVKSNTSEAFALEAQASFR